MEPIKTASTIERIVRNAILTVMVVVFAILSFRDGYVSYPEKNLVEAKKELPPEAQDQATINPKVLEDEITFIKKGMSVSEVESVLGPPSYMGNESPRIQKSAWFGPGGTLIVRHNTAGVLLKGPEWCKGQHTETDLLIQKIMGVVLTPLGLYLLFRLVGMLTFGVKLSDAGLKPTWHPLIPFDAMTGLDAADYKQKGRIGLTYSLDGREGTYVLDDYKLRAFPAIVEEICKRKGFENPIRRDEGTVADTSEAG